MSSIVVATMYKFVALPDCDCLAAEIREVCRSAATTGTLIFAHEGVNGTVAGSRAAVDAVLAALRRDPRLADLEVRSSHASTMPFLRMKVRTKPEIVTMRVAGVDPSLRTGTYVEASEWNEVLRDPGVFVLDCRNGFEVAVGTFVGAVDPGLSSLSGFPWFVRDALEPARHRRVAMFCTGGIRCEKASSYLLRGGFATVLQLRGGILAYLEAVTQDDSLWRGECFTFDRRVALVGGLRQGEFTECRGCKLPIAADERRSPLYESGVSCPHCSDSLTSERRCNLRERVRQMRLAEARDVRHLGAGTEKGVATRICR